MAAGALVHGSRDGSTAAIGKWRSSTSNRFARLHHDPLCQRRIGPHKMHSIDANYAISPFASLVHCTHIQPHEATATRRKKTNRLNIMTKRIISRTAAGLALALLATAAFAGEPAAIDNTKTVGALTLETQGLAIDTGSVHRQGGYALPGAVQWTIPATDDRVKQAVAF